MAAIMPFDIEFNKKQILTLRIANLLIANVPLVVRKYKRDYNLIYFIHLIIYFFRIIIILPFLSISALGEL